MTSENERSKASLEPSCKPRADDVLFFSIPGLPLCLPLQEVVKVLPIMALQEIPDGPDYLAGLLNYRGNSLMVIDLSLRLGKGPPTYTSDTPVILCAAERQGALIVSDVRGVGQVAEENRQMRELFSGSGQPFRNVFGKGEHLNFMLDTDVLFDVTVDSAKQTMQEIDKVLQAVKPST